MRTEFKDESGAVVATVESDNQEFLLAIEQRVLGTRMQAEELDVWVASASVYDDSGTHVMDYEPRPEPKD
jgi:hypothetical protein